jgi:hypothetical protein
MGVRPSSHGRVILRDCARLARIALLSAVTSALASCAPAQAPTKVTVSLRLQGTPPDATVVIDDENIGSLAFVQTRGVALPPGKHHISVTAPGFFPWDKAVEVKPGDPLIRLDALLVPVPD